MSVVHIQDIQILNANARFQDPYLFKITFECIAPLAEDLEWKLIYVGSSTSTEYDQELDSCLVGPVPVGINCFPFEAAAPSPSKIPPSDLLGVTVILLTASYRDQEFVRVGYYVHNEYDDEEMRENPPEQVRVDRIVRSVLVDKPRVTRFNIKWDSPTVPTTSTAVPTGQTSAPAPAPAHSAEPGAAVAAPASHVMVEGSHG